VPTNNFQITWDPTNKKWTAIEDGAAAYDLVENSLHETIQYNEIAAPGVSGAGDSLAYMDSTAKKIKLSENAVAFQDILPLTTKGDLATFSTVVTRLAVGGDGTQLETDSTQATGLKWGTGTASPLTTKGDLWTYAAADARLPVGADYRFLVGNTAQSTGLEWFDPPYCELYRSGSFTTTNGANVIVTWNGTTADPFNMHPGSSATITVPVEGTYHVEAAFGGVVNKNGNYWIRIYPSVGTGIIKQYRGYIDRPAYFYPSATFQIRLPANGTFTIYVYQNTGGTRTWCTSTTWSRLWVHWIGAYN
jgi:hypothetical protein